MADSLTTVERVSALAAHYKPTTESQSGVTLCEVRQLTLWQLAVWPDTLEAAATPALKGVGIDAIPGFCQAVSTDTVSALRIEPCKFWVYGAQLAAVDANDGAVLDLSHSRTHIRIHGPQATTILNSYLPLDLRERSFPLDSVASTAMHHVGVTLWRSRQGYELFVPRGFAVSIWELLCEASEQYGLTIT